MADTSPPVAEAIQPFSQLGIAWHVGVPSGWGTYGMNLAIEAVLSGVTPQLYFLPEGFAPDALQRHILRKALKDQKIAAALLALEGEATFDYPVLHALGDRLDFPDHSKGIVGAPNVGVVFFEHDDIPPENLAQAAELDLIVTGSAWNQQILEREGLKNAVLCRQGVDSTLFHPAPRRGIFKDRFALFAGGKLEYRKGQDITLAAFKEFHTRHPQALLVTAWQNRWQGSVETLARSPYTEGVPRRKADGSLDIVGWAMENGLPADAIIDLGELTQKDTAPILRECDAALLPSRCEGGTNLVAMEAMACGLPVVLSANTGHFDLIAAEGAPPTCLPLKTQMDLADITGNIHLRGWGESLIAEASAALSRLHDDAALRQNVGTAAADMMAGWSWKAQIRYLLNTLA